MCIRAGALFSADEFEQISRTATASLSLSNQVLSLSSAFLNPGLRLGFSNSAIVNTIKIKFLKFLNIFINCSLPTK